MQCVGNPRVSTIAASWGFLLVLNCCAPRRVAPMCSTRFDNPSLQCPTIFFVAELNYAAVRCSLQHVCAFLILVCHSSSLSRSLLALYSSLHFLSLCPFNHVTAELSVIYAVYYPCHGSPYKPYFEDQ